MGLFCPHRAPGGEASFSQNSPSLPKNSVRLSEFSSPKQYSRHSCPFPICGSLSFADFLKALVDGVLVRVKHARVENVALSSHMLSLIRELWEKESIHRPAPVRNLSLLKKGGPQRNDCGGRIQVDMLFLVFLSVFVSTTGLQSFSLRREKPSK